MNYFDDLVPVWGDEYPRCRAIIDRRFETIYSVQLSLGGPLDFARDHGSSLRVTGPLFFWHHPSRSYQYCPTGNGFWHHLWISFRGQRGRRLLEEGFMALSPAGYLIPRETRWAAETMRELIRLTRAAHGHRDKATLFLEELLLWAREETTRGGCDQAESIQKVREIAESVRLRPDRHFNFPRAAAQAGLSQSHFRSLFRQVAGHPPRAYLLRQLMERAAADLANTSLAVGQVGIGAGYADPAQFSKAFKKRYGLSPESFRAGLPMIQPNP